MWIRILFDAHKSHEAWGKMEVGKAAEPMQINTVFDMASLTKPVVAGTAVMILMERGLLDQGRTMAKEQEVTVVYLFPLGSLKTSTGPLWCEI